MAVALPDDLKDCASTEEWKRCHELDSPGLFTLRNCFTRLLKHLFSDPKHLVAWGKDLECKLDKLHISPGTVIDPGNTNMVPGVLITTGDGINYEKPWINSQWVAEPDYASMRLTHMAKVNMTFVCSDYDPDVVAKISDEVMAALVGLEPLLYDTWNWLKDYKPVQQTSPQLAKKGAEQDSYDNYYESRVIFEVTYEYATETRIESRRMQDFMLQPPDPKY